MLLLQPLCGILFIIIGCHMTIINTKILLALISSLRLGKARQLMAQLRNIPEETVYLDENRDAAEALIYYVSKHPKCSYSRSTLARAFDVPAEEIDYIIRRVDWRLQGDTALAGEYRLFLDRYPPADEK